MLKFWTVYLIRFVSVYFIFSVIVASFLYPGGNIFELEQIGYSFTKNYLSDLGGYKSRSGEVNFLSSFIFNSSMVLYLGSGIGFLFVPTLFKKNKKIYLLSIIGSFFFFSGCFFFAGVGLTPHDLYQDFHGHFAKNAFRLLVPGLVLYFFVLMRSNVSKKYSIMIFILLFFTLSYVVYQIVSDSPLTSIEQMVEQAIIQKIITFINIICMFFLSFAFSERLKAIKLI